MPAISGRSTQFLNGGGEMGELIRAFDWERTPIGAPHLWPQSLRTAVRLMLTSRHPMFIWWGPELIQFYNDAYRETLGPERHPSALGSPGRECWDEIWPIIGPQIEMVMRGGGPTWNEDQLVPVTRNGSREDVWWTYGYSPIDDEDGVGGVLVVCRDVTHEHRARAQLAAHNQELNDAINQLKHLFEQAPGFIAVLEGPEHVFTFTNAAYRHLVGREEVVGLALREALPGIAEQGFSELLDTVYRTGGPYIGTGTPVTLQYSGEAEPRQFYLDFIYQPIRDSDGNVSGIFVEGYDVTSRFEEEQRRSLLVREMNHRVKNVLSTVQSLAMLSGRTATSVSDFTETFGNRIHAMVKTQSLLIEGSEDRADVKEILESELAPYLGQNPQVQFSCEPMSIAPKKAVSLGLLLHELLTNAAKYGALSVAEGRLQISCTGSDGSGVISWRETTPHEIEAPEQPGFGSRLIGLLAKDLGGTAEFTYHADGLEARVRMDLTDREIADEA